MEGIKKSKLPVIQEISHRDVMYSIGNAVNNIVITLDGDKWLLVYHGDYFVVYINVEPLCCTPETNIAYQLYVN